MDRLRYICTPSTLPDIPPCRLDRTSQEVRSRAPASPSYIVLSLSACHASPPLPHLLTLTTSKRAALSFRLTKIKPSPYSPTMLQLKSRRRIVAILTANTIKTPPAFQDCPKKPPTTG